MADYQYDYQEVKKQKMVNEGYCNKIKTFFDEYLSGDSFGCGDRAEGDLYLTDAQKVRGFPKMPPRFVRPLL